MPARCIRSARGDWLTEAGFVGIEGMAAGASPDGLIADDGLLEIKCPEPGYAHRYLRLPVGECPKA